MCAVAIAECFRGDGEILANPIGTLPMIGGRLAKATFEPELVMTDGEALLVENILPVGVDAPEKVVVGLEPVPHDVRRRVVGPPPRDDGRQPDRQVRQPELRVHRLARRSRRTQLLGMRGAPGNTINDKTSYWIPDAHARACSCPQVDVVSGVGYDRAARARRRGRAVPPARAASSPTSACCDFETPDHRMRLRSVHPGVTVDDVVAATGFELAIDGDVPESRLPTDDELRWIREVIDPLRPRREGSPEPVTGICARRSATCSASTCRSCRPAWAGSPGARLVTRDRERGRARHPRVGDDDATTSSRPRSAR